jgi:hypothetical protein
MTKRSVFRDFISALRAHWRSALPDVRLVAQSFGPTMPKASTFYAGFARPLEMHVFLNVQHSSNAWQVGSFTINVILSKREGAPEGQGGPFAPRDGDSFTEGSYRIGSLLAAKDKWWQLKADSSRVGMEQWRAESYRDEDAVLIAAVDDVTRDVRAILAKLGVEAGDTAGA